MLALVLLLSPGAPPQFVVENKMPAKVPVFVVENRIPVTVPVVPELPTDPNVPAPAGYEWIKRGNGPWKLEKLTAAAPGVAAPTNFRNPSHACPTCGRVQTTVDQFLPNGRHSHRCPYDNTVFTH